MSTVLFDEKLYSRWYAKQVRLCSRRDRILERLGRAAIRMAESTSNPPHSKFFAEVASLRLVNTLLKNHRKVKP